MTLTAYNPVYFDFLNCWITDETLLFQFAGAEFTYPITEEQLTDYQQKNPDRQFYIGLNEVKEAIAFGEVIPQKNNVPRLGRLLIGNPANRGKGFGTSFIRLLLIECRLLFQTETVELFVLEDNLPAIRCYQKIGFEFLPDQSWTINHKQHNYLLRKMSYQIK